MREGDASRAELDAARLLLERMGISPLDLLGGGQPSSAAPTFEEYVPVVVASLTAGTRKSYERYLKRAVERWGSRPIDAVSASEIRTFLADLKAAMVVRRNSRGGRGTQENAIAALRCLYRRATADGFMKEADNPALKVAKPKRLPSTRRALPDAQLQAINVAAVSGGADPELDGLLVRLHTETACRRGGALSLRPEDLDVEQCLIVLREKGETFRWQPVSPTLMRHLQQHGEQRGAVFGTDLLRYRDGHALTYRHYDHLWARIGKVVPWVASQQISTHWLRHTTLTWVERNFGYAVARAYAGHSEGVGGDIGATAAYVRASMEELAQALSALTDEQHPLAAMDSR